MTLDPQLLEDAIRRNDSAQVRELLRDATEADRRASAKALKSLLDGPEFVLPQLVAVTSAAELRALRAKYEATRHERAAREREREEWVEMARTVAFRAAAVGLAGGVAAAVQAATNHRRRPEAELDVVAGVLADRRPPWLADFAGRLLGQEYEFEASSWPLARRLVRLGAIGRPDVPEYATKFTDAVAQGEWVAGTGWHWVVSAHDGLLADPGLLEDEVWRLFTVPDAAWRLGEHWADALALLAEEGHLDRDRLIDETLAAFTRDFVPHRVGWYATLHDRLSLLVTEMAARTGAYLGLLAVSSKPGVTVAQRAASRLLDTGLLAAEPLLQASGPALLFPQKSVAVAQLKLIGKAVAQQPGARARGMATAAQAFSHQREDVQEAALKLIARYGIPDGPDRAAISELAGELSPTFARDAAALGLVPESGPKRAARQSSAAARTPDATGEHGTAREEAGAREPDATTSADLRDLEARINALRPASAAGPRAALATARSGEVPGPARVEPSPGRALPPPLDDPEELVQLLTQLMEDASDALAVERAIASAVRLSVLPAGDRARLAGPLLKRAEKRAREDYSGPFSGREITADMACVAMAWGAGWSADIDRSHRPWNGDRRESVRRSGDARTMAGIVSARAWEATTVINSGQPAELLAEPEFERGGISQDRLLDRLTCRPAGSPAARLPRHDLEVALLRLAPGVDDSFWSAWARLHPTSARAARLAHSGGLAPLSFEPVVGEPAGWYPHHDNRPGYPHVLARITGPPADSAGHARSHCWTLLTALASPLRDYRRQYGDERQVNTRYDPVVAAWPLLCPWQPELSAAHLLRPLSDGLKPGSSPATTAVGCLASPGHPLGLIGHLALVTGLASAEPDTRIAAAEVWSRASLGGRLDPKLAASAIVTGVTGGAFMLSRIAHGLHHASQEPLAGYRIIETVFAAAEALTPAKPASLHLLFELAVRIGATTGLPELPVAITGAAGQKANSRLAAAARRLATCSGGDPAPARGQAIAQALAGLTARAEPLGGL